MTALLFFVSGALWQAAGGWRYTAAMAAIIAMVLGLTPPEWTYQAGVWTRVLLTGKVQE